MLQRKFIIPLVALGLTSALFAAELPLANTASNPVALKTTQATKVNLNQATMTDLMKIKGLNKMKARNIVSYRKKQGNFKSVEDLKNVKGFKKIKPVAMKAIEDQLSIA